MTFCILCGSGWPDAAAGAGLDGGATGGGRIGVGQGDAAQPQNDIPKSSTTIDGNRDIV